MTFCHIRNTDDSVLGKGRHRMNFVVKGAIIVNQKKKKKKDKIL